MKCKGCGAELGSSMSAYCPDCHKQAALRNLHEAREKAVAGAMKTLRRYGIDLRPARPSDRYDVRVSIDGDMWCCLYGENLQDGLAGFGATPGAACRAFDHAWDNEAELAAREKVDG